MRKKEGRPGQVGKYWPSKKPGRNGPNDPYCRTWYGAFPKRQTHRISLGTSDFHEATVILANWVVLNDRPDSARPDSILIESILLRYWEDHAKRLPSVRTQKDNLARWQRFWAGKTVAEITANEQRRFREFLGEGKLKPSTIDKILSTGRAALRRAVKYGELTIAPHIFQTETREQRRSRKPLGRPITLEEIAKLIDSVQQKHLLVFLVIEANTLARPTAILELRRSQYDSKHGHLHLNPEDRQQTKKHRPVVPVTPTLKPWLESIQDPNRLYVSFGGKGVLDVGRSFKMAAKAAGLEDGLTPYSFRHGIARAMRGRGVPMDQISHMLGHIIPTGSSETTAIYAPFDPNYCVNAVAAIEAIMSDVRALMKTRNLDNPKVSFAPKYANGHVLDPVQTTELRRRIRAGERVTELARSFGLSTTAVYKHRNKLRKL